jgi:hypothetical protein
MFGQPPTEPDAKPASDQVVRLQVLVTANAAPNPSDKYGGQVWRDSLRSRAQHRPSPARIDTAVSHQLPRTRTRRDLPQVRHHLGRRRPHTPGLTPGQLAATHDKLRTHLKAWRHRRPWLDPAISTETTMCHLHRGATTDSPSLALISPKRITGIKIDCHPGPTPQQRANIGQYACGCPPIFAPQLIQRRPQNLPYSAPSDVHR